MEDPELLLQELHKLETLQRKETTSFNLAQLKLEQLKSELQTLSTEADHLTKIFEENNTQIKTLSDNAKNEELHVSREELLEENLRSEIVHKKQSLEEEKQGKERELSALRNKFEDISNKCSSFCEFYSNQPSFKPIQALKDELKIVTLECTFTYTPEGEDEFRQLQAEVIALSSEVEDVRAFVEQSRQKEHSDKPTPQINEAEREEMDQRLQSLQEQVTLLRSNLETSSICSLCGKPKFIEFKYAVDQQ